MGEYSMQETVLLDTIIFVIGVLVAGVCWGMVYALHRAEQQMQKRHEFEQKKESEREVHQL